MVGVALPSIGAELDLSTSSLQWLVSGYILGYGGLLLLGGRTADLLGRRKVFLIALARLRRRPPSSAASSATAPLLIVTRFVKGLAAAFTAPTGLSIITTTLRRRTGPQPGARRSTRSSAPAATRSGLLFGGLMTGVGWRWTFLLPVPIALAALVAAFVLLPKDRPAEDGGHDLLGAALSSRRHAAAGLHRRHGARGRLGVGAERSASFVAGCDPGRPFVLVEQRVRHPLVRLGILRKASLVRREPGHRGRGRLLLQLAVHRDPVPAGHAGLVAAEAGARPAAGRPAGRRRLHVFSDKLVDRFGTAPDHRGHDGRDGARLPAVPAGSTRRRRT